MTTALLAIETALLAVVALFVVALLRSHAEILRRLASLEPRDLDEREAPARGDAAGSAARREVPEEPGSPRGGGERAPDIAGRTLVGDAVKVRLGLGSPTTLLAFLSSGCAACGPLWEALHEHASVPAQARLVVVAKGPERESTARLHELAPPGREVLLSTEAWREYAVPGSPHFVLVDGRSGRIAGRGSAASWEQISAMVEQAVADAAHATPARARTTGERAARAERALAAAGIGAGHPSLYPAGERPDPGGSA
jgi:hypothetical protein